MSHIDPSGHLEPAGGDEPIRHNSSLAITSLVMSVIFCCPLTTITGLVLGLVAFFRFGSNPTLKGKWMAVTAMIVGLASTIGQALYVLFIWTAFVAPIMAGPQAMLIEGSEGRVAGFVDSFVPASPPLDRTHAAEAFLKEVKARYGAFHSAEIDQASIAPAVQPSGREFKADYMLRFENGAVRSTCTIEIVDAGGEMSMKFLELVIHDADRGDIQFPAEASEPARDGRKARDAKAREDKDPSGR